MLFRSTYQKFAKVLEMVRNVMYSNTKSMLNKISIFDESEYKELLTYQKKKKEPNALVDEKLGIYKAYISFVQEGVEDNELILLKMDHLLLELSNLNSLEDGQLEKMPAMQEIDELIAKTKFYK